MRSSLLALPLALAACSAVRHASVRPDYPQEDRTRTVRLVVVVAPLPAGREDLGALWGRMARRWANHHRDFIVKGDRAAPELPEDACGEGIEGVLHLAPEVGRAGGDVSVSVRARLSRCRDGQTVWEAEAAGTWPSEDEHLVRLSDRYATELGEEARPHVAPTFRLLRETLATLPRPYLATDDDVMEKIEMGE